MPSILSRPIRIGRMELKNRMVMAPMGVTVGNLTPASVAYFAARAEGGAAMVPGRSSNPRRGIWLW